MINSLSHRFSVSSLKLKNLCTFRWKDADLPIEQASCPPTSWYTEGIFYISLNYFYFATSLWFIIWGVVGVYLQSDSLFFFLLLALTFLIHLVPLYCFCFYLEKFFKEVEVKHTFKNWLCYGRTDQLSEPNSYLARQILDEPIVVVNIGDGKLAGYYNVCRHHAAQICDDGEGQLGSHTKVIIDLKHYYKSIFILVGCSL